MSEEAKIAPPSSKPNEQRLQLGVRLEPVNNSDRPLFANISGVQGAPGIVFLDFGFIDPSAFPAVARLAQSGAKTPEAITGQLTCRVALGLDTAVQFARQLEQHLGRLQEQRQQPGAPDAPKRK